MKRFEFSMSKLLSIKKQMLNKEKNELAGLKKQQQTVVNEKAAMKKKLTVRTEEMQENICKGVSPQHIANHKYYIQCLGEQIKETQKKIDAFEERIRFQLTVIVELNKEIDSLEKLRDRQMDEYKKGEQKRNELFIEEFVSHKDYTAMK
ncbi:MAG: flagellar FliJ family protein [Oscillospiraceae bacterium]|jgi:flagellar export protein FliJ